MPPEKIAEVQENIENVRQQVLPQLPILRSAGFELVLRRIQRQVDSSIGTIVKNFEDFDVSNPSPPSGKPNHQTPFYATHAWPLASPWVLKNKGQQGLYNFAQNIKFEVIRERMRLPTASNPLPEIYGTIAKLHGVVRKRSTSPPSPLDDWATVVAFQKFSLPNDE